MPKTIFITSFHPLISRNILQTKLLTLLAVENNKVVILVPDFKKDYFVRSFGGRNVFIEGVNTDLTKKDLFFRKLTLTLTPTRALYIKKRSKFYQDKNIFKFLFSFLPAYLFGRFNYCLKLARFFDYFFLNQKTFKPLLDAYNPDLIFATDVQNELDVRLLQEARKIGLRTIGMVRSWDNLTTKGILRIIPDHLVVHNEIIKKEAMQYSHVSDRRISVIGIPHYDRYLENPTRTKEEFFRDYDFDINKKLIIVGPVGNRYIHENQTDKATLETLSELDLNILVRIPPCDVVDYEGFKSKKAKAAFDKPGFSAWKGGRKLNEMSRGDEDTLINSIYWSDAVVSHLSSMCIDAAFFDKPIVVIGTAFTPHVYWDVINYYHDYYEHIQPILRSGGIKIVNSPAELLAAVNIYLQNPSLDTAGRQRIVREQVQFLDGRATKRLADIILA